jgi:WhiB family transcriptional regulator, redox-sensing transcriptional regulator
MAINQESSRETQAAFPPPPPQSDAASTGEAYSYTIRPLDEDAIVPTWQKSANCLGVDPDLFFPERGGTTREAKEVCRSCVVKQECLEYALNNGEKFGVWGGLSERERRRLRRRRNVYSRRLALGQTAIKTL